MNVDANRPMLILENNLEFLESHPGYALATMFYFKIEYIYSKNRNFLFRFRKEVKEAASLLHLLFGL